MIADFAEAMAAARRLTADGDLTRATSLIQAALNGVATAPSPPKPTVTTFELRPQQRRPSAGYGVTLDAAGPGTSQRDAGETFEQHRYAGPDGALDYWLHTPAGGATGRPLVVMLHGCTQSPTDFARGTGINRHAAAQGVLVAYPAQASAANAQRCWNWFLPGHQQRGQGEPAAIAGMTRRITADHAVDPARVYVAGLSAGGAAAAIMGSAYPDIYAAIGVHSGLACGAARDLPSALAAMRSGGNVAGRGATGTAFVPVISFHGDRDATVNAANAGDIAAAAAAAAGCPLTTRTTTGVSIGGRAYTRKASADASGIIRIEQWTVHGAGHAWAGGDAAGSYTDPAGPDASAEMLRFFRQLLPE